MKNNSEEQTSNIVLTEDQEIAKQAVFAFLMDDSQKFFTIEGCTGTEKTTLIREILLEKKKHDALAKLINPNCREKPILLSATNVEAVVVLKKSALWPVGTIHSLLNLFVKKDYESGKTTIKEGADAFVMNRVMFIDGASDIDEEMLQIIDMRTIDCKVIFIGDRTQATTVNSKGNSVFNKGYPGAMLNQVILTEDI